MKKLFLIGILLSFITVNAQDDQDYADLLKSTAKVEVKSFIYDELELTETEENAFNPVFDKYLEESGKISVEKAALFDSYADNMDNYSSDQINTLNKDVLKTDLQKVKTDKKYYNKFVKAIGVEKTTQFFFLKKYLDNIVEGAKLDFLAE
ncbi:MULTISPECIES: hypothetical protein [Galbibacter]|uniref:Peptidylprolyl isomerase n=1 Tax=Galbibacter pacificus TaxID=2996052 RepID=A0ABT6FQW9_9FLAO|nr:hypothetical protein [Galbibacter pacificus]MDG3581901.1 hypothetical protein [Galbibacter pacificus]MDG3585625.1 hypothetical protein [Galbibacter pacificus]